jgi:hypothetical protein
LYGAPESVTRVVAGKFKQKYFLNYTYKDRKPELK